MSIERPITVLGAGGWIGAALVAALRRQGRPVWTVNRAGLPAWLAERDPQGPLIYAIGLTADFRQRPHATAEAHVGLLSQVLRRRGIEQLLYLSSTRVYARSADTSETTPLTCLSSDPSDLYNLSKLLGEALVLQDPRPGLKVVRLSNVVGPGQPSSTFVGALLEEARTGGVVTIQQPADTAKDYVAMVDVTRLLPLIAERGRQRLYNLGSGRNTSHAEVAAWLERQGAGVRFASGEGARKGISFPPLAIAQLAAEFEPPADPFRQTIAEPDKSRMTLNFEYDESEGVVRHNGRELGLADPEAFELISQAWLRTGWDTKYVYGFSWLGRPVIQLPEDLIRIQELIYALQPDVIVETGVAHGGSLIFYAGLCAAMAKGRVIGIDIEIRPHNRTGIETHRLSPMIELVEGSSTAPEVVQQVQDRIGAAESVLVLLDSNHSQAHVAAELEAYGPLVSPGSYIVACDGIMKQVAGAPRTETDWNWNNPISAVEAFLANHLEFEAHEPEWPFNEGLVRKRVSYWPQAYLRRKP